MLRVILTTALWPSAIASAFAVGGLVNTTYGPVQGQASSLRSGVSEYLGIRYAKAPVGDLRFAAPVAAEPFTETFDATAFSPDCPCNRIPMDNSALGGAVGQKITTALSQEGNVLDEDCLSINIWTKPQSGEKKKAVLFFIYGGGFNIGSSNSPVYDGSILADENDVVVVSLNYRLNIFGFSGAPGQPWNVGLLDQRLALEWTRDNIEAFGGDASRITVFGQSAGGLSTDFLAYAYVEDPIAHAFIAHSGVASSAITAAASSDAVQANWYNVSATLGCGGAEAGKSTVACVRSKKADDILAAIAPLSTTALTGGFTPVGDGKTIPYDLAAAAARGNFARLPFMVGNTDNEAGFFFIVAIAYNAQLAQIPNALVQPLGDLLTLIGFTCPAAESAEYRARFNVPVWRYRYYGGNYTNTYIVPVGSAYHTSDLLTVFGTAADVTGVPDSDYEAKAGAYQRKAWATFAKNPTGLQTELYWPQFRPLTRSEVQLSLGKQTQASYIFNAQTDALCPVIKFYAGIMEDIMKLMSRLGGGGSSSSIERKLTGILSQPFDTAPSLRVVLGRLQSLAQEV